MVDCRAGFFRWRLGCSLCLQGCTPPAADCRHADLRRAYHHSALRYQRPMGVRSPSANVDATVAISRGERRGRGNLVGCSQRTSAVWNSLPDSFDSRDRLLGVLQHVHQFPLDLAWRRQALSQHYSTCGTRGDRTSRTKRDASMSTSLCSARHLSETARMANRRIRICANALSRRCSKSETGVRVSLFSSLVGVPTPFTPSTASGRVPKRICDPQKTLHRAGRPRSYRVVQQSGASRRCSVESCRRPKDELSRLVSFV